MKRLIIICEGPTEIEFCNIVLLPHFFQHRITVYPVLLKKSSGGIVAWGSVKKQIEAHLKQEWGVIVTTFIDYYGIKQRHLFPSWDSCMKIVDKAERLDALERAMREDLGDSFRYRFIPYIQLHEFEGLLFNNITVFDQNIPVRELADREALQRIIDKYPNPELINDNPETSPSHRLRRLVTGYKKTVYGPILASEIGLDNIRAKCPRFNKWIEALE